MKARWLWAVICILALLLAGVAEAQPAVQATRSPDDLVYVGTWGEAVANGRLLYPEGLDVGPDGHVYVADTAQHRIQVFAPDGAFLRKWGSLGQAPGQFKFPNDVVVSQAGLVYVSDAGNNRVQVFDAQGRLAEQSGGQGLGTVAFGVLEGLAIGPTDELYVADSGLRRIMVFGPDGAFRRQWNAGYQGRPLGLNGIGVAPDGSVVVAGWIEGRYAYGVQVFTAMGGFVRWFEPPMEATMRWPKDVAVGPSGVIYVAAPERSEILAFRLDGTYLRRWTAKAKGLAASGDEVYAAITDFHNIRVYSTEGAALRWWGAKGNLARQFDRPVDLAVGLNGDLYVGDAGNDRIVVLGSDGSFVSRWGREGSGEGEFNEINGLGMDREGNLYVADRTRPSIDIFQADGAFVRRWNMGTHNSIADVAVDAVGDMYMAALDRSRVDVFSRWGVLIRSIRYSWGGVAPWRLCIDADDLLYITAGTLTVHAKLGAYVRSFGGGPAAVGPDGRVYVVQNGVRVYSSLGEPLGAWDGTGDGEKYMGGRGIALGHDGTIFVADPVSNRIHLFRRVADLVPETSTPTATPSATASGTLTATCAPSSTPTVTATSSDTPTATLAAHTPTSTPSSTEAIEDVPIAFVTLLLKP